MDMNIEEFKEQAESLVSQLEDLIHQMPQKGNKSYECQRVTLQIAINEVSYAINGTEQADLEEDEDDDE
jgi:frataxin-like iron-binding protein CyaY